MSAGSVKRDGAHGSTKAVGFTCLAFSWNAWIFILGIAVFSIGEMTAHPKYYSYVGLVAPADRKAVYMGYAFLYGVFGSLIGSSLGGALYGAWLKPVAGTPEGPAAARWFWLFFVALDLLAVGGLFLYDRAFARPTPEAEARARRIMLGLYGAFLAAGAAFLVVAVSGPGISWKTLVQALILVALGVLGLLVSRRPRVSA